MPTALMEDSMSYQQPPPPAWQQPPGPIPQVAWQPRSSPPRPKRQRPAWPAAVWPLRRRSAASPRVLVAAVAAGAVGAITFRIGVIGVGYAITGAALLVAGVGCSGARPSRAQVAMASGSGALLSVASVRSAGWLVT